MAPKAEEPAILILGDHTPSLSALAERIRPLGFRAIRAKTPDDAIALAQQRHFQFSVALIEPRLGTLDLGRALAHLRERCGCHDLSFLATGPCPSEEERTKLREAGVTHAVWEPVADHVLLFQLNRALDPAAGRLLRGDERVPTEWTTHLHVGGRQKSAVVYSLSGGGAFLATARPSMRGAKLAVDLPLPSGNLSVLAKVLYTNVPGNLERGRLPNGMGVCFVATPPQDRQAISNSVSQSAARYFV